MILFIHHLFLPKEYFQHLSFLFHFQTFLAAKAFLNLVSPAPTSFLYAPHEAFSAFNSASQETNFLALAAHTAASFLALRAAHSALVKVSISMKS